MPIRIQCIDETKFRSINSVICEFYVKLSEIPSEEWKECFKKAFLESFDSMKRKMRISDEYVIIECPEDELEKHQIPALEGYIETANKCFKETAEKPERTSSYDEERELTEKLRDINRRLFNP
ncbi:MAG: hypothetical protein PWQ24_1281 [Mesotoga sp.]|nr:hypothetical protein [Mesotoga sp.]